MWSREELETVIVIEPPEKKASVYTNYNAEINKLRKFAEENPDIKIVRDEGDAIEIELPSNWISIRKPRKLSEEQKNKSVKALAEWREKNKTEKE